MPHDAELCLGRGAGRGMTLLAEQTALWLGFGLGMGLLFAITMVALFALYFALFDRGAEDIEDVQRFIELTEEARCLLPPGLPLFEDDTAAAIIRFQAKKDEARRALWAPRDGRRTIAIAEAGDGASRAERSKARPNQVRPK
jgi:hypothetical protein